jgi:hypothetical protein
LLPVAVTLLTLAVVAGTGLALWYLRATDQGGRPPAVAGALHGGVGTIGLVALLFALRGQARGVAAGVGSFGATAAILFAAALISGLVILARRQTLPAATMAIHAGFAITGYVLLLAWNSLG